MSRFHRALSLLTGFILLLSACSTPPVPSVSPQSDQLPVKLQVDQEGVYRLSADALRALGLDPSGGNWELSYRGQRLETWQLTEGGPIRFYVPPPDSRWTSQRYVILTGTAGALPRVEDGDHTAAPENLANPALSSPYATLHLEENRSHQPMAVGAEPWLWAALPGGGEFETSFTVETTGEGQGGLRLHLWASTSSRQDPDHHLQILLNGETILDETWDGAGRRTLTAVIPAGLLAPGANQVRVISPGDTGAAAELVYLDWIELDLPLAMSAPADPLAFTSPGGTLSFPGLTQPAAVFDITLPLSLRLVTEDAREEFQTEAGHRYWLSSAAGASEPAARLPLQLDPALREAGTGADYLVIGAPALLEALQPLLDLRASQGLLVRAVPFETAADSFSFGFQEPHAIQALLAYARQNWTPAPRYVLLVGDASYDALGYLGPGSANRLPAFWVETVYGGETASDLPYALSDADGKPALAVGRLPASEPGQVSTWVEKIMAFENGALQRGRNILAVADPQESGFATDAQFFVDGFGPAFSSQVLAPAPGDPEAPAQVLAAIEAATGMVAYFGHGSLNMWGRDRLFSVEEVANLQNGANLPVFLTLTCLNGLFTHPKSASLAEALLWQPGGGAVAVLAPTSLTLSIDQRSLSAPLVQALQENPQLPVGDALLAAQRSLDASSPGARDVLYTFLLFGDPAMRVFSDPAGP